MFMRLPGNIVASPSFPFVLRTLPASPPVEPEWNEAAAVPIRRSNLNREHHAAGKPCARQVCACEPSVFRRVLFRVFP